MATRLPQQQSIPAHFHFIWYGRNVPDFARVAIVSALDQNPGAKATLWHGDELDGRAQLFQLRARGVTLRLIDPDGLFDALEQRDAGLPVEQLRQIYEELSSPAARANVVRMVVLYLHGGIYLDTDTLTLKDFGPLRKLGAFCGEEPTLWPAGTALLNPKSLLMSEVRRVCSLLPHGFRIQKRLMGSYTMAANNAVVGARENHPFVAAMLRGATKLSTSERTRRYRLGTHLLQKTLDSYVSASGRPEDSITVLSAEHFYPLGPEISSHYFHRYDDARSVTQEILGEETYAIHWYASVSDLTSRDAHYIRKTADRSVYSSLCRPHIVGRHSLPHAAPAISPA